MESSHSKGSDMRSESDKPLLLQVNSIHVNPVDANLIATCSNDWSVRLNDVRMLNAAQPDSKGLALICLVLLDHCLLEYMSHINVHRLHTHL